VITIETKKITESTAGFCAIIDITAKLNEHIQRAKIRAGTATLFVPGSTAALTTIEHEPGLIQDLKEFVEKYIPSDLRYHHDIVGAITTVSPICAPRSSAPRWRFPSKTARLALALGSK
jgi:thiamine phosphate synthase YjbQ (UPF0047 family)